MGKGFLFGLEGRAAPAPRLESSCRRLPSFPSLCSASEVASVHVPLAFPSGGPGHCQGTAHPPYQHSCGGSAWCRRVYVRPETVPLLSSCDPHGVCLCPRSEGSWRLALQSRYVLCPALPPPPQLLGFTHTHCHGQLLGC